MSTFDERQRAKGKLEDEMLIESFYKLANVVVKKPVGGAPGSERLQMAAAMDDLGSCLNVTIPYASNPDLTEEWYQEECFRPQGIMWRTVQLKESWYEDAIGAMLGSLADGTPVVLMPAGSRGCLYRDPETGRKVRVTRANAGLFRPEATLYYRPLPQRKIDMGDVWAFIWKCMSRREVLAVLAATVAVTLLSMVSPYMTKLLTSSVVETSDQLLLTAILFVLILVSVAYFLVSSIKQLLLASVGTKVALPVQAAFMMRVLIAPAGQIRGFSAGDLGTRVGNLYNNVKSLVNMILSMLLTAVCSFICVPQMLSYAPSLVGVALIIAFILIALYAVVIKKQVDVSTDRLMYQAEESGLTYSLIDGMQKITLSGAEKRAYSLWARVYRKSMQPVYDPPFLLKVFSTLTPIIMLAGTIVMYAIAATTGVSQSDFYAFLSSYSILTGALSTIGSSATGFAQSLPTFHILKPVMDFQPETGEGLEVVKELKGNISLRNVTFRYAEDLPPVLEDLNIEIQSGEYVAIVGPTGCGKSTVLRLLLGFETPNRGEVLYDGKNLKSLDLTSLRRRIGTVLQDGEVFKGTIFSNITIAGTDLAEDDAWQAAEVAGIAEDIRAMPMKMNTPLSDGGRGVSGGQKQRLLIARAIVSKPSVLFFDEATSALDNETQKAVSDRIGEAPCTRLVIAHRLSTVEDCDRILCLNQGHIVEEGTYDELMQKGGFFAELVRKQQL